MNAMTPPLLLVVEDEALLLLDVEHTLKDAGFETVTVSDAPTAIREIEQDCARFGALVTDIDLGGSANGWEVARHARQLCPALPVIYMSGGSTADWSAQGVPKSVMLAKPFAPAQLVTAVATLMNELTTDPAASE